MQRSARRLSGLVLFIGITVPALTMAGDQPAPPAHPAGSICVTPYLWCWLPARQQPGSSCLCPSPYGNVYGSAR